MGDFEVIQRNSVRKQRQRLIKLKNIQDKVTTVQFNKSGNLLGWQVAGKTIEIFSILDEDKVKRKAKIQAT